MGKRVIVVGGGIAGMQTALKLSAGGVSALLLERDADLGGKLTGWHKLFPSFTPAHEVLDELRRRLAASDVEVRTRCEVAEVARDGVTLSTGERLEADAVVVATGFTLFDARIKEEYGYGIYDNVYTTVDIERMLNEGRVALKDGTAPRRIAFSEGERLSTIKAAVHLANENIAMPLLVGSRSKINALLRENHLTLDPRCIVDFQSDEQEARRNRYATLLYNKVSRKGVRMSEAIEYMMQRDWFTLMMVDAGDADTSILGYTHRYTDALKPVRQIFTTNSNTTLATMEIVTTKRGPMFFADTAVNPSPTVEDLVNTALMAAQTVRNFGIEPVIGMLSHSNFGTDTEPLAVKIAKAVEILHFQYPDLLVDGEMKADIALNKQARNEFYPFNKLGDREINVLIFPNLSSANISYKMMEILGGAEINGPILMGLNRSCVHLIPEVASTRAIRNLSVIAAAETIPSK